MILFLVIPCLVRIVGSWTLCATGCEQMTLVALKHLFGGGLWKSLKISVWKLGCFLLPDSLTNKSGLTTQASNRTSVARNLSAKFSPRWLASQPASQPGCPPSTTTHLIASQPQCDPLFLTVLLRQKTDYYD